MTLDMTHIINQMISLFLLLAVGYIASKLNLITKDMLPKLSNLMISIIVPASVLSAVINVKNEHSIGELLGLIGIAVLVYVFLIAFAYLIPPMLAVKKEQINLYRFMTVFTNAAYMGFPVITAIYGSEGLFYAMLFQLPFNALVFSYGAKLIAGKNFHLSLRKTVVNIGTVTAVLALIVYVAQIPVPTVIDNTIDTVGGMTAPFSMLIIGATLGGMPIRQMFNKWRLYPFAVITNVVLPLILYFILRLFVVDQMMLQVSVVIAAMPVATVSGIFCHRYGGDAETASAGVFISTAMSVGTIPLLVWLMQIL
ncbi:MAG: AEC family transporter [Clostridia bacterium]|nr:AEC family transporter [Clostridia bacterium]